MSNPFEPPRASGRPATTVLGELPPDAALLLQLAVGFAQVNERPTGPAALLRACTMLPVGVAWLRASGHDPADIADLCEERALLRPAGPPALTGPVLEILLRARAAAPADWGPYEVLRVLATPAWYHRFLPWFRGTAADERNLLWWRGGLRGEPPARPAPCAQPGEATLVLLNDDRTPMIFACETLVALGLRHHVAMRAMLCADRLGEGEVGAWAPDQAEALAEAIRERARDAGWPLQVRVDPPRVSR